MKFRLVYEGPLQSTQRDPGTGKRDRNAMHKHSIRQKFHVQLKELWSSHKYLREAKISLAELGASKAPSDGALWAHASEEAPLRELVGDLHKLGQYRFVPMVREDNSLTCSLDILFLRRDIPGSLISAGDIDNRIKTLIDALRMPQHENELVGSETPGLDENPFYSLLEDDKLVTSFSVTSDTLLKPISGDERDVHIVITVDIRPYYVTMENLNYT